MLKHDVDDDQFAVECARLVNVTGKLVEFEKTIPERLAELERWRSERIVTWSWRGEAAVGVVLIAFVFVLDRSVWWLVLVSRGPSAPDRWLLQVQIVAQLIAYAVCDKT